MRLGADCATTQKVRPCGVAWDLCESVRSIAPAVICSKRSPWRRQRLSMCERCGLLNGGGLTAALNSTPERGRLEDSRAPYN